LEGPSLISKYKTISMLLIASAVWDPRLKKTLMKTLINGIPLTVLTTGPEHLQTRATTYIWLREATQQLGGIARREA
jgi:hypothetical protein